MGVLSNLEPKPVFNFFEQICEIPHGSGNIDKISDYLVDFAKERGLFYIQDEWKNVIIIKEATAGYETQAPIILQGHMDMVAVKDTDCEKDLEKDGLDLMIDGDYITAKGTSLGGDDGIFVAYALALLDAKELSHPRLEVIFTVDEEVGMEGAKEIDLSMLRGKRMLNLDSEEEGKFWCSCAGGARVDCKANFEEKECEGEEYRISISGLTGGHSGTEIHRERGNANILMARILTGLAEHVSFGIKSLKGGAADNAIANSCNAVIILKKEKEDKTRAILNELQQDIRRELRKKDSEIVIELTQIEASADKNGVTGKEMMRMLHFLRALPYGVQGMSAHVEKLVETSLNMGVLTYDKGRMMARFAVRSSVESRKKELIDRIYATVALAGGTMEVSSVYPGWEFKPDSPFREKLIATYKNIYGKLPEVEAVHAGLECGFFASKIKGLDCISMGPDILDIHSTKEKLGISSSARVWEFLVKALAEKE